MVEERGKEASSGCRRVRGTLIVLFFGYLVLIYKIRYNVKINVFSVESERRKIKDKGRKPFEEKADYIKQTAIAYFGIDAGVYIFGSRAVDAKKKKRGGGYRYILKQI